MSEGPSATFDGDDSDLVPLPMNNLYNLTEPGNSRLIRVDAAQANGPDFISRGVVSISEAEYLFDHFRDHINPQLWDGVLCSHQTLHSARQSSSLLVATVLTVAALHVPNRENFLHVTYNAFVSLMRGSCLRRSQNLDDIRGLCIGAFYLTSLSWALCSRAVRVATEMNLHKSSLQFSCGTLESYERVRLWYVLYVCDHQFALAYGRPPMMHEDAAIRNADRLLTSVYSTKGDRGLVAQVGLFRILAASYFMYGCDADLELNSQDYQMLQSFNLSIDKWRLDYQSKDSNCLSNTDHTSNGNALYYQLARFQLNSLSLRGISARRHHPSGPSLSWDRQEAANIAISAASSTLSLLLRDADLREALVGMPIFTHAMIAVCASFLLKMAVVFAESNDHAQGKLVLPTDLAEFGLNFQTSDALVKVKGVVQRLSEIAERASQGHVANQVVMGLRELLQRFRMREDGGGFLYSRGGDGPVADNTHHGMNHTLARDVGLQRSTRGHSPVVPNQIPHQLRGEEETELSGLQQEDPFDLMGDLDWRFNDSFLWGIDGSMSFVRLILHCRVSTATSFGHSKL